MFDSSKLESAKKLKALHNWIKEAIVTESYEYLPDAIKRLIELVVFYQRGINYFSVSSTTVETPVIDCTYYTNMMSAFQSAGNKLKIARVKNTHNVTTFGSCFYNNRNVEIIETLDFSSSTNNINAFHENQKLVTLKIVPSTIKSSINFPTVRVLSNESIQNIFDGLAPVTTAQTLTLASAMKILQSQVDSANAKGWTVAGGTIVTEEEYYGQE